MRRSRRATAVFLPPVRAGRRHGLVRGRGAAAVTACARGKPRSPAGWRCRMVSAPGLPPARMAARPALPPREHRPQAPAAASGTRRRWRTPTKSEKTSTQANADATPSMPPVPRGDQRRIARDAQRRYPHPSVVGDAAVPTRRPRRHTPVRSGDARKLTDASMMLSINPHTQAITDCTDRAQGAR